MQINHCSKFLTVQSLLYNKAGAKRNGATTFFELVPRTQLGQHFLLSKCERA